MTGAVSGGIEVLTETMVTPNTTEPSPVQEPPWRWRVVEVDLAQCLSVRDLNCTSEYAAKALALKRSTLRPWAEERVFSPSGELVGWARDGKWRGARS